MWRKADKSWKQKREKTGEIKARAHQRVALQNQAEFFMVLHD